MKILTRARGLQLTDELSSHSTDQIRTALGRFADRLRRVEITLLDVNGPRGGIDKECKIMVVLEGVGTLVIRERSDSAFAAISNAADRCRQAVSRTLDRVQYARRGRGARPVRTAG